MASERPTLRDGRERKAQCEIVLFVYDGYPGRKPLDRVQRMNILAMDWVGLGLNENRVGRWRGWGGGKSTGGKKRKIQRNPTLVKVNENAITQDEEVVRRRWVVGGEGLVGMGGVGVISGFIPPRSTWGRAGSFAPFNDALMAVTFPGRAALWLCALLPSDGGSDSWNGRRGISGLISANWPVGVAASPEWLHGLGLQSILHPLPWMMRMALLEEEEEEEEQITDDSVSKKYCNDNNERNERVTQLSASV